MLVGGQDLKALRAQLGLSQGQLAALLGVHWVTASKWERGLLIPDPYRQGLLACFAKAADDRQLRTVLPGLLVSHGVAAALYLLLKTAFEGGSVDEQGEPQAKRGGEGTSARGERRRSGLAQRKRRNADRHNPPDLTRQRGKP